MFGKSIRNFAPILAMVAIISAASVPAATAASDGAEVFHQSVCLPSGQATVCIDYHSVINRVATPSGTSVFTQNTRSEVTATSASGMFLYSFERKFRNQFVFAQGEPQVNVAHFTGSSHLRV